MYLLQLQLTGRHGRRTPERHENFFFGIVLCSGASPFLVRDDMMKHDVVESLSVGRINEHREFFLFFFALCSLPIVRRTGKRSPLAEHGSQIEPCDPLKIDFSWL